MISEQDVLKFARYAAKRNQMHSDNPARNIVGQDDLVQEACLAVLRKMKRCPGCSRESLLTAAKSGARCLVNVARRQRAKDEEYSATERSKSDKKARLDSLDRLAIKEAVDSLPRTEMAAVKLVYWYGMGKTEIVAESHRKKPTSKLVGIIKRDRMTRRRLHIAIKKAETRLFGELL
jgi:DNA-directed RNA polymerase specialized sigma24 family protein